MSGNNSPWYDSGLFWGCASLAGAIILTVIAAMLKDLRWLLAIAWPLAGVSVWVAFRRLSRLWRWLLFLGMSAGIGIGLLWLNSDLKPMKQLPESRNDVGVPAKSAAVVEVAGFDNLFNAKENQVASVVHARNIGPGIARNVQGIVWILPGPFAHDERDDFVQALLFSKMLESFRKERARNPYAIGRSLAIGQVQDFSWVSPSMSNDDYKRWKNTQYTVYLIAEITWQDDAGDWKTDLCEHLSAPTKIPERPAGIGIVAPCDNHNGIAEPLLPHN